MAITAFSPSVNYARFATVAYPTVGVTPQVVTTGTSPVQMTLAQVLQGLLPVDCQSAGTFTTPTAAAIVAGINGCQVGTSFDLDIVNYGAATLTIGLGAGVTKTTIATVSSVLTMVTLVSKRFKFVVTNVTPGSEAVVCVRLRQHGRSGRVSVRFIPAGRPDGGSPLFCRSTHDG
jgi:hypothetical protein